MEVSTFGRLGGSVVVAERRDLAQEGGGRATQATWPGRHQHDQKRLGRDANTGGGDQRGKNHRILTSTSMQSICASSQGTRLAVPVFGCQGQDVPIG